MTALRVLILDFDGVVLESNDIKTDVFDEVFAQFPEHHDAMMAFHAEHRSASRYEKFSHLVEERLGRRGDRELIEKLAADFSSRIEQRMTSCRWVPGAEAFLNAVAPKVPLYLASVTPQPELDRTIRARGLGHLFRGIYGCPPWDKRRAIDDVVSRHGGARHGVILVGDSAGDQRAAAAAGVSFIARDSGLPFDRPQPTTFADMVGVGGYLAALLE